MVYKDYKNQPKTYVSNTSNRLQDPTSRLSSYLSSYCHPSRYFFEDFLMQVFLSYHPLTFACCFLSSFRHAMQKGVSEPKIISLYTLMLSLIAFSSSSFIFIQLRQGMFNVLGSSNRDVLFIYLWFL